MASFSQQANENEIFEANIHLVRRWVKVRIPPALHLNVDPEQIALDVLCTAIRRFSSEMKDSNSRIDVAQIRAYCFVVADHMAINAVRNSRSKNRGSPSSLSDIEAIQLADRSDFSYPSQLVLEADLCSRIGGTLDALHRRVLELRLLGNDNPDIADELNVSVRIVERLRNDIKRTAIRFRIKEQGARSKEQGLRAARCDTRLIFEKHDFIWWLRGRLGAL